MVLRKCLFSFVLCSSGGNKTMTQTSGKINYPSWRAVDMCESAAGSGLWNLWNRRQQRWWEGKETTSLGKWDQGQRWWDSKACGRWCSPSLWPCGHNLAPSLLSTQQGSQGAPAQLPSLSPGCPEESWAFWQAGGCGGQDGGGLGLQRTAGSRTCPPLVVLADLLMLALMVWVV